MESTSGDDVTMRSLSNLQDALTGIRATLEAAR